MPQLSSTSGKQALDDLLQSSVDSREVPAVFFGVTNAEGTLYSNCAGEKRFGDGSKGQVDEDTTLQLFSSTKLLTTIACLQLLDRGLVTLDDPALIETHLPELASLRILKGYEDTSTDDGEGKGEPIWEEPKTKITLRMLLSHTSGMGYTFNSPNLDRWTKETSHPSFLGPKASIDSYALPLVFEPKTQWHYSVGIDWAGHLVHRLTHLSLEEYFQEHIFKPCGMRSTSFYPGEEIRRKAMAVTYLDPAEGKIKSYPDNYGSLHYARPERPEEVGELAGGAGLFGTAKDYLGFLRGVLASDPSRRNNSTESEASKPLISGESFRELFNDSIPRTVPKTGLLSMMQRQTYHDPTYTLEEVGHSVGLCLNFRDSKYGRKAGSGCWDGAAKTQYWLDPVSGIAGVCFTNIFAQNPNPFMDLYTKFERTVYDHLE